MQFPRVVSPIEKLFTRDGIAIGLISVELWPRQVVVRLAALPSEATDAQQHRHEAEMEQWEKIAVERGMEAAGPPPADLGERLLLPLEVAVEDDVGTLYTPRAGGAGGSGNEWHGDWFFKADVPELVGRLTIRVRPPDGEAAAVTLDLGSS